VIHGVVQNRAYLLILVSGEKLVKKALGVEPFDVPKVKFGVVANRYRSHHFQRLPCLRSFHHTSYFDRAALLSIIAPISGRYNDSGSTKLPIAKALLGCSV
jgi:hypothetical protein